MDGQPEDQTPMSEPAPSPMETTWPAMPPAGQHALAGIAGLAATPVAPPASRRPRAGLLATVAVITVLAVLGGSAAYVFANFIRTPGPTDSAKYVPDTAVAYVSVDLVALSTNTHHFNLNDALSQSGVERGMKQATGLDWKADVQPWIGRFVSVAAFPSLSGGASAGGALGGAPLAVVAIISSRDDGAATTAVDKVLAKQTGTTYAHGSYGGFTQRTATGDATTVEIGSGLVVFASTQAGAHAVVDRVNGHGATLSGNSEFIRATGDLPSDRYGTVYVGLKTLTDPLGTGGSGPRIPFLDTYPTIAGSFAWTADGTRIMTNLKPVRAGVPSVPLNGDTTGLAALVPAGAAVYAGAAKGGPLAEEFTKLIAMGAGAPSPVRNTLGVDPSDPALAQPAAFFLTSASSGKPQGGLLLRAPDVSAANALLAKVAAQSKWTSKAITVGGTAATEYDTTTETPNHTAAVSLMVQGTLVVVDSATTAQAVLATASGGASLAQAANFQRLVSHGPANHAVSLYADSSMVGKTLGRGLLMPASVTSAGSPVPGLSVSASLLTLEWSTDHLRLTADSLATS
jgi:hypothetical protein